MSQGSLGIFPGSPFARMARVLILEWALPIEVQVYPFPPPPEVFRHTPLGQIPFLLLGDETVFPTSEILERLWAEAGQPTDVFAPERGDRKVVLTTLLAGDAMVAAYYQGWTGLGRVGTNHVDIDLMERNLARLDRALGWLDGLRRTGELRDGLTLGGVAAACIIRWGADRAPDERPLLWRQNRDLAALVDELEARESFRQTAPPPWRPV